MHTAPAAPIRTADMGDVLAAGQAFPMRNALVRTTPASARALFAARHAFWLAAAAGYLRLVDAGCTDSSCDVADALEQAARYAA